MSARMACEAQGIRALFAVHGCEPREAALKVVELYSPPRVTREFKSRSLGRRYPAFEPGSTFDFRADEPGVAYNFLQARDRQRRRERLRAERPWLVIGCPPRTWWCQLMAMNRGRTREEERDRREAEAQVLLDFACEVYRFQLAGGRRFLPEHPTGACSWQEPRVVRLLADARVGTVVGHQCQHG
eukprot:15458681-Alexandrium_andersonii.AAC.1